MILDRLVIYNFGVYSGPHIVELAPVSAKQPIILFGGLNGGGKTTLLDALQLVLYGKSARCSNRGTLTYEEFLRASISRGVGQEEAALELEFRQHSEGREHRYRVRRAWSATGSTARERVAVFKDGEPDGVLTDAWGEYVEDVMPARISHLFFFDGEQIERFADWRSSKELLATAIHSLLGLDIVDRLVADLTVLERRKRASAATAVDRKVLDELAERLRGCEERRGDLVTRRAEYQNELDRAEKRLRRVDQAFKAEGGDLYERRQAIECLRDDVTVNVRRVEDELRELSEGAAPLLLVEDLLSDVAEHVSREERLGATEMVKGLLEERDARIVAFLRDQGSDKAVITKVGKFLSRDRERDRTGGNQGRTFGLSPEGSNSLRALRHVGFEEIRRRCKKLVMELAGLRVQLLEHERALAGVPAREAIEAILAQREEARNAVSGARAKLSVVEEDVVGATNELERLNVRLSAKLSGVAEGELEAEDNGRLVRHAERVKGTLAVFRSSVVGQHVHRIERLVLEGFQHLLRKQSLVADLRIDPEALSVDLFGADMKRLAPDRLSAGERQLLAVSLLWGLARASGRPLPAVIDTPLGRLDSSHRMHLVERYFPFASHQVLLLSTDEEIDQGHHERLKPWIGRSYRLDFDDRSGSTTIESGYFW